MMEGVLFGLKFTTVFLPKKRISRLCCCSCFYYKLKKKEMEIYQNRREDLTRALKVGRVDISGYVYTSQKKW